MNAPLSAQQREHAFLARLGERVRAWRTEHGMTRKQLSVASGVSERRALERVLGEHPQAVIATGGSLVTDPGTYELLLERCRSIWLKAAPEEHMARVIAQGDMRPFKGRAAALDEIRKLLDDRDRLYGRANAVVDTSGKTVRQSLTELRKLTAG